MLALVAFFVRSDLNKGELQAGGCIFVRDAELCPPACEALFV